MKKIITSMIIVWAIVFFVATNTYAGINMQGASVDVCTSPKGGCQELIRSTLAGTHTGDVVTVLIYQLTSPMIMESLITASQLGADVRVIADAKTFNDKTRPYINRMVKEGVKVCLDHNEPIHHNKVIIISHVKKGYTVMTGSYNFSTNAEMRNAENYMRISVAPQELYQIYLNVYTRHKSHCEMLK